MDHSRFAGKKESGVSEPVRRKFREDAPNSRDAGRVYCNLMYDPRVYRGKTCVAPAAALSLEALAASDRKPSAPLPRLQAAERAPRFRVADLHDSIQVTPSARTPVPLHLYLTEQAEPTITADVSSQTDALRPQPPEKEFVAAYAPFNPLQKEVACQVQDETAHSDRAAREAIFQFDRDTAPLVQLVVEKTLAQSLMEVREETELENLRIHRVEMTEQLRKEATEVAHLEKEERVRAERAAAVLAAARAQFTRRQEDAARTAAAGFASALFDALDGRLVAQLQRGGFLVDPVNQEVQALLPKLAEWVEQRLHARHEYSLLVDALLMEAVSKGPYPAKAVQLFVHADDAVLGRHSIGPIEVTPLTTVEAVQQRVVESLQPESSGWPADWQSRVSFHFGDSRPLPKSARLLDSGVERLQALQVQLR